LENRHLITLDYENRLFLNTAGIDETEIKIYPPYQRRLSVELPVENSNGLKEQIEYHGKNPLFVHVNGPDKTFIRTLLSSMQT
jgi:hypothetical protein